MGCVYKQNGRPEFDRDAHLHFCEVKLAPARPGSAVH